MVRIHHLPPPLFREEKHDFKPIVKEYLPRVQPRLLKDGFIRHYNKHGLFGPVRHQEVEDDKLFVKGFLYNEWYRRFGDGRWASAIPVENTPCRSCGFSLVRSEDDSDFTVDEMREQQQVQLSLIQSFRTVAERAVPDDIKRVFDRIARLTPRVREAVGSAACAKENDEIGILMGVSPKTVENELTGVWE